MSELIEVAVLGATGIAGQQMVVALAGHPWFRVRRLAASDRCAGETYRDALRDESGAGRWCGPGAPPELVAGLKVEDCLCFDPRGVDLVFSALPGQVAGRVEAECARTTPVVSTASAFRTEEDTPILLGGVNPEHARLFEVQRARRGWRGLVAPKPNCSVAGLALSIKPLLEVFGISRLTVTSLQAVSGAGRSGPLALDMTDNVIPYIPGEEAKVETEPRKILGRMGDGFIEPAPLRISATCTRVPVLDGHLLCVDAETDEEVDLEEARRVIASWGSDFCEMGLPTSPARLLEVVDDPFRPQPRLDRDRGGGMTVTVGRLRRNPISARGLKYVALCHNTRLGAAGGAIQTAEYLVRSVLRWV